MQISGHVLTSKETLYASILLCIRSNKPFLSENAHGSVLFPVGEAGGNVVSVATDVSGWIMDEANVGAMMSARMVMNTFILRGLEIILMVRERRWSWD